MGDELNGKMLIMSDKGYQLYNVILHNHITIDGVLGYSQAL